MVHTIPEFGHPVGLNSHKLLIFYEKRCHAHHLQIYVLNWTSPATQLLQYSICVDIINRFDNNRA